MSEVVKKKLTTVLPLINAAVTVTNVPAAETTLAGSTAHIRRMDLTGYNEVRLVAKVSTVAAATTLRAKFATSAAEVSTTVANYTKLGLDAADVAVSLASAGIADSGWIKLNQSAMTDVNLCLATQGGDGALDPVIDNVTLFFRTKDKYI